MNKWLRLLLLYSVTTLLNCSNSCPVTSYTNLSCEYCKKDLYHYEIDCNTSEYGDGNISFKLHENQSLEIVCENSPNWAEISIHGFNIEQHLVYVVFTDCQLPTHEQLMQLFRQFKIINVEKLQILTYSYKENHWNLTRGNLLGFSNIKKLSVLNYYVKNLPSDLLIDMKNLTDITIGYNEFEIIPETFFSENSNLQNIEITGCKLKVIERNHFRNLEDLENLSLTENNIIKIEDNSFDDLKKLKKIDIQSNNLNLLPQNLFLYHNQLEVINLSENNFSLYSLSSDLLKNVTNLKLFKMWNNRGKLETLPHKFFSNLEKLERIYMHGNGLEYLPSNLFFNSNGILRLYLNNNNLTRMPEFIFNSTRELRVISLASNNLICLPRRIFSGLSKLMELDLSNNYLEVIQRNLFSDLESLKELYLEQNHLKVIEHGALNVLKNLVIAKFSNNRLTFTPSSLSSMNISDISTPFQNITSLKELDLSHNLIPHIFKDWLQLKTLRSLNISFNSLTKLEVNDFNFNASFLKVDLSHNMIHDISLDNVDSVSWSYKITKSIKVKLANNPINCSHNIFHLLNYLEGKMKKRNRNTFTLDVDNLRCDEPIELKGRLVKDLEAEDINELILRNEISPTKNEIDENKIYDAFISYSHKDDIFVNALINELENGTEAYKLCVHYRDWPAGEWIADQVFRSVNDSRRTIVVLSKNFISSEWGKMEFRAAYHQALNDNVTRVIIVVYGEIPDMESLDNDLKFFFHMTTYVKWDDPKFWEKLKYALPHNGRT